MVIPAGTSRRRSGLEQLVGSKRIDPAECAREAARRFRPGTMADRYLELYRHVPGAG